MDSTTRKYLFLEIKPTSLTLTHLSLRQNLVDPKYVKFCWRQELLHVLLQKLMSRQTSFGKLNTTLILRHDPGF